VTYTVDDSVPGFEFDFAGHFSSLCGGASCGYPGSPVSNVFTINGHSISNNGNYVGEIYRSTALNTQSGTQAWSYEQDYNASGYVGIYATDYVFNYLHDIVPNSDYHSSWTHLIDSTDNTFGYFTYLSHDNVAGNTLYAYAGLNPTSLTVSSAPEPANWLLNLAGLGLLGGVARRRRKGVSFG